METPLQLSCLCFGHGACARLFIMLSDSSPVGCPLELSWYCSVLTLLGHEVLSQRCVKKVKGRYSCIIKVFSVSFLLVVVIDTFSCDLELVDAR